MVVRKEQASYHLILCMVLSVDSRNTSLLSFSPLQVQPFLPQWLAQPKLVQKRIKDNLVPIEDVPGIHPRLLKKLQVNGIESFFPGTLVLVLFLSRMTYVVPAVCFCIVYVVSEVRSKIQNKTKFIKCIKVIVPVLTLPFQSLTQAE